MQFFCLSLSLLALWSMFLLLVLSFLFYDCLLNHIYHSIYIIYNMTHDTDNTDDHTNVDDRNIYFIMVFHITNVHIISFKYCYLTTNQ